MKIQSKCTMAEHKYDLKNIFQNRGKEQWIENDLHYCIIFDLFENEVEVERKAVSHLLRTIIFMRYPYKK